MASFEYCINLAVDQKKISKTTAKEILPAQVTDLTAVSGTGDSEIDLSWSAVGDDDMTGTAATYIIRYNTEPVSDGNWGTSTDVPSLPAPSDPGTLETKTVTGLDRGTTYYFAIKVEDDFESSNAVNNLSSEANNIQLK